MTEEDQEQNIDDLVDYNDFDSKDLESEAEQDSFNNDILKIYEDHKKNLNNKSNEMNNNQRPISKYQRIVISDNRPGESSRPVSPRFDENLPTQDLDSTVNRLNLLLKRNKVTLKEFCDDVNIFLDFSDFKELFKKIRFDISHNECLLLFNFNNPNKDEGYILCSSFICNLGIKFEEIPIDVVNTNYDLNKINEDFKIFNSEIIDIVKKDIYETNMKRLGLKSAQVKNKKLAPIGEKLKGAKNLTSADDNSKSIANMRRPVSSNKLIIPHTKSQAELDKPKLNVKNLLQKSIQKQLNEERLMKNSFDKREKEFIKECIKKINEANKIVSEMHLDRLYDTFTDSNGKVYCELTHLAESRDESNPQKMELKSFVVHFRILYKSYLQSKIQTPDEKLMRISSAKQLPLSKLNTSQSLSKKNTQNNNLKNNQSSNLNNKLDKREIKKEIKKVLVNSIRLKIKLKQQITSLKHKIHIDEKIILENLKLSAVPPDVI